jgi:hypothetical protein
MLLECLMRDMREMRPLKKLLERYLRTSEKLSGPPHLVHRHPLLCCTTPTLPKDHSSHPPRVLNAIRNPNARNRDVRRCESLAEADRSTEFRMLTAFTTKKCWRNHLYRHGQQNKWPHSVTTGSCASSRQILHSKLPPSEPLVPALSLSPIPAPSDVEG